MSVVGATRDLERKAKRCKEDKMIAVTERNLEQEVIKSHLPVVVWW